MFLPKILIALAFCAGTLTATAQTAKKISTLKSQRANLQKKIKENEGMLKTLKKDVRSQLNNLSVLNGQINSQKKLVDAIFEDLPMLRMLYEHCLPYYEKLYEYRLKPKKV